MSLPDFFQYLLGDERSQQLGSQLMAIFAGRVEHRSRQAAGAR
jgi:hypothetical protein